METRHKQLIVLSSVFVIRVMVFFSFLFLFFFFFLADRHDRYFQSVSLGLTNYVGLELYQYISWEIFNMLDMPLVTMGEKLGKITLSVSASVYCIKLNRYQIHFVNQLSITQKKIQWEKFLIECHFLLSSENPKTTISGNLSKTMSIQIGRAHV